jgi:ribonucleoside-triphosphate reductase
MSSKIRKRSGHQVPFDMEKIYKAVDSAFESCGKKCPATFRAILNQNINKFKTLATVERIQDEIEDLLISCGHRDIYKHFSGYRAMRAEQRAKMQSQDIMSIVNVEVNDITTDNANMSAQSPAGMMMKFAGELTKPFSKQYFLAPNIRQAMNDNYMYVHDLDYYPTKSTTCVQTPLNKLLEGGLYAGHGEIRPAKRIETAVIVAAISLETTQNEQHGGQAIPAFDFYMAPYVRKTYEEEVEKIAEVLGWDDAKIREHKDLAIGDYDVDRFEGYAKIIIARTVNRVHQAMESFIHNCNNIHSRGGLTLG